MQTSKHILHHTFSRCLSMVLMVCFLVATMGSSVLAIDAFANQKTNQDWIGKTNQKSNSLSAQTPVDDVFDLLAEESEGEEDEEDDVEKKIKVITHFVSYMLQTIQQTQRMGFRSCFAPHAAVHQNPIYIRFCTLKIPS